MYRLLLIDDTTGKQKRGPSSAGIGGFVDQDFDSTGQVNFVCTTTFGALTPIDIWVNGRKQREGATYDFTRNTSLNRIEFNSTIPALAWVQIRIFA